MKLRRWIGLALVLVFFMCQAAAAFQSDELSEDDEEWGIVGGGLPSSKPISSSSAGSAASERLRSINPSTDKKVQFSLEHSFGGSEFKPAGVFTVRVRESAKGGQTLSKFRLTRNPFSNEEKKAFLDLLENDGFYSIRVPANVLNPGKAFALSSVKARCLASSNFQERFDFHMDHGHVIGITYGGSSSCSYPRALQPPSQWTFDTSIIIKSAEQSLRSLVLPEVVDVTGDGDMVADDGTVVKKIPERTFWQKYWMYLLPVGLIVVNAITQIANLPEEGAPGQGATGGAPQQRVAGPAGVPRRR